MHKFSPENWLRLENENRRKLLPPEQTLRRFGLKEGMTLVDIGAGTGYFSREAANLVGNSGKVFAAEMSLEMVEFLRDRGVPPAVEVLQSEEYSIPIKDSVADLTWIAFVTHETPDIKRFLNEAVRLTRHGGKIVILEWKKQDEERGPAKNERLDQAELRSQLNGHRVIGEGSLNPSHYYIEIEIQKSNYDRTGTTYARKSH